jgi:hypothetical protein
MKELCVNVIHVYTVDRDPTLNYDEFMDAFAAAGIYALVNMSNKPHANNPPRNGT